MNGKIIEKIRKTRFFSKGDLILYSAIICAVIFLFVFFVFLPLSTSSSNGFIVTKNNKMVCTFISGNLTVKEEFIPLVTSLSTEDGTEVTVYVSTDKLDYNVIMFYNDGSAKITKSTCSNSKDCCYFNPIKQSGIIYCAPHSLKLEPFSGGEFLPPISGGVS